jgi:hypothetical protein
VLSGLRLRKRFTDRLQSCPKFRNAILDPRHHALAVRDLRQPGGLGLRAELFGTYHETLIIFNDGVCTANGRYYAARW